MNHDPIIGTSGKSSGTRSLTIGNDTERAWRKHRSTSGPLSYSTSQCIPSQRGCVPEIDSADDRTTTMNSLKMILRLLRRGLIWLLIAYWVVFVSYTIMHPITGGPGAVVVWYRHIARTPFQWNWELFLADRSSSRHHRGPVPLRTTKTCEFRGCIRVILTAATATCRLRFGAARKHDVEKIRKIRGHP